MKRAIFFDRDGVINKEIYRKKLKKWSAPHKVNEVVLNNNLIEVLKKIKKKDFFFFIISNQPDYALGYTKLENLKSVHKKIKKKLSNNSIFIKKYFYSFRHNDSLIKKLGPPCYDKKPNPFFLKIAKNKYNLNLKKSWIIGDRETDILCGKRAGLKTIGLKNKVYTFKKTKPDYLITNFNQILKIIYSA